jgi:iduronate 2-sulfatase
VLPAKSYSFSFLFLIAWLSIILKAPAQQAEINTPQEVQRRPNVLFIISDDLNNRIGCYGDPQVQTPHIDALAKRGVRFEHAYCQFPLCGPSRNSMLCGLYPNSTGILANSQIFRDTIPQHHSLPQDFRLEGYFASRVGKLYHYNVPKSIGTNGHDDPGSWELELNPAGCDRLLEEPDIYSLTPGSFGGTMSWYASPRPDAEHTDGLLAEDAQWILERCAKRKDRPFFLALGFYRPHTPYVAPQPYFEKYALDQMPLVTGVKQDQADIPPAALSSYRKFQEKLTDQLEREAIQAYYASITFMDQQVGTVLKSLDELGLAENTIVVFTSDHGYHLGEHGLWQKMSLFEGSVRVPLIIAVPGIAGGQVVNAPVGLIDLYPTLTGLCKVKAPESIQGQSLIPMLLDSSFKGRGFAISQVRHSANKPDGVFGYSIRTEQYRYTEWNDSEKGRELYDHLTDPQELVNLAQIEGHDSIMDTLAKQLHNEIASNTPQDGVPELARPNAWAPNLTDP